MKRGVIILTSLAVFLTAQANTYSFNIFTSNGVYGDNPGLNLWAEVFDGAGTATFKFHNDSLFNCSLTQIYFDDGALFGLSSLANGPGAHFGTDEVTPGPGNLPSGNNLDPVFVADREFSIAPFAPVTPNGVGTGEWVSVTFDLASGMTLQDVFNEIASGELRVGIHVQAFPDGSSEAALMIPEPASVMMIALGSLVITGYRKIRKAYGF